MPEISTLLTEKNDIINNLKVSYSHILPESAILLLVRLIEIQSSLSEIINVDGGEIGQNGNFRFIIETGVLKLQQKVAGEWNNVADF